MKKLKKKNQKMLPEVKSTSLEIINKNTDLLFGGSADLQVLI